MTAEALTSFLSYGTSLLNWIVDGAISIIGSLMNQPVTACFLIAGLIGFVFTTYRMITHR